MRANGDDFEDFVFECFRIAKGERGFTKRLARGRDGAIDLIGRHAEPGKTTIAECKYIGSGKNEDADSRWAKVFRNLEKNLPELSANPAKRPDSPYRGWLDPDSPVTCYRFCVTAAMTPAEVRKLEKRIAADFKKLVELGVKELRTLAQQFGAVRVLPWDWFAAELVDHPSLCFRWFDGLPAGVKRFEPEPSAGTSFRDFLSSGQLAYFSRDDFARQGTGSSVHGEAALVTMLAEGPKQVLLITGPGGVGKTRLVHELATTLSSAAHQFDTYWLGRSASSTSVTELAAHYPGNAKILLLVDYAEAAQLDGIADAVSNISTNSGHRVCLIMTCRASAAKRVSLSLTYLASEEKSLGPGSDAEAGYLRWVTASILALDSFPEPAELELVCHAIPALAAFALFLIRTDRAKFDKQFSALLGIDDFEKWANRRISALTAGHADAERQLARIALALPMTQQRYQTLRPTHGAMLDRLIADCWIESEGNDFVAAHDVLADALLAHWLFGAELAITNRATDLLSDAAGDQELPHGLTVLARLGNHPRFKLIDGMAVVAALLLLHPEQVKASCNALLGSPLLTPTEKLNLLDRSAMLRDEIKADPALHLGLSQLADAVARARRKGAEITASAEFGDLLDHACEQALGSNLILRRAYAFDPKRFRTRALANLAAFPRAELTHFLLVQMLRSGEPIEAMREPVRLWLEANSTETRASFVYKAWLDADGGTEAVSAALLAWIEVHGQELAAEFVYKAWLDAGGGTEAVSAALLAWVEAHGQELVARFVYTAWLDARGETAAVSAALLAWVEAHGQELAASHVYEAWLKASGGTKAVSAALLAWVEVHGQELVAEFVYKAWLDAHGGTEAVSAALLAWVGVHGQELAAEFVYQAWLGAGGEFAPLRGWIFQWALAWCETEDFVYLSKPLSKMRDLPEPVILAIARWSAAFPQHEDCLSRLSTVVSNLGFGSISGLGLASLLRSVEAVVKAKPRLTKLEREQFWRICAALARGQIYNLDPFGVIRCTAAIIASGHVFGPGLDASELPAIAQSQHEVVRLTLYGLREGELDLARDHVALASLAAWLRASIPNPIEAERLLALLKSKFPGSVWE